MEVSWQETIVIECITCCKRMRVVMGDRPSIVGVGVTDDSIKLVHQRLMNVTRKYFQ